MGRADVSSRNPQGARSISKFMQAAPHLAQPSRRATRDVLDDDESRLHVADDSSKLVPETGSLAGEPCAEPRTADVLTRKPAADDPDFAQVVRSCFSDICHAPICVRPVLREHLPTERILFNLPHHRTEASALETKFEPANA
jgi:hypothetical protein